MKGRKTGGRKKGTRNRATVATRGLLGEGESPLALLIRISQDEEQELEVRMNAARWASPFLHPKPFPAMPWARFTLPNDLSKPDALR